MKPGHFITLACVLILTRTAAADTTWVSAGNVSGSWTAAGSPYMILGDIAVPTDSALSIGPGVTFFFTGPYGVDVDSGACISALGTENDSVRFTTDLVLNPLGWRGLTVRHASDTCRFRYCVISQAGCNSGCHALYVVSSSLDLSFSSLRFNQTTMRSSEGGALRLSNVTIAIISHCEFVANRARNGAAAAVFHSNAAFERCTFQENTAATLGGAVDIWDTSDHQIEFSRCSFVRNQCETYGGAVAIEFCGPRFEDCIFLQNSAGRGGAVDGWASYGTTMIGCTLKQNSARTYGGALYDRGASWPHTILQRCLIVENSADSAGGGIYVEEGMPDIEHCTIVQNSTAGKGSAVFGSDNSYYVRLNSTIVAFNRGTPAFMIEGVNLYNYLTHFNVFFGNDGGDFWTHNHSVRGTPSAVNANGDSCDFLQNIYLDPRLADPDAGDYRLTEGSPCIDAGDTSLGLDPDSTIADIGAFYFPQPSIADPVAPFLPSDWAFHPAYPNPFNAVTVLRFELARSAPVKLVIYDVLGREVAVLADEFRNAGSYAVTWDAHNLSSGLYLAALETENRRFVQKVVLLK